MKKLIIGLGLVWVACNRDVFDRLILGEGDYKKRQENNSSKYEVVGTGRLLDSIEDKLTDIEDKLTDIENRLDKTI